MDGDGDFDLQDVGIMVTVLFKALQIFFDVTLWVVPFGACLGGILTMIGAITIFSTLHSVAGTVEDLFREVTSTLDLSLSADKATQLVGIDLSEVPFTSTPLQHLPSSRTQPFVLTR